MSTPSAWRLDLWLLEPQGLQRWAQMATASLSPEEQRGVAQLRDPGARERAAGRRAFLRGALAAFSGRAPEDLVVERGPNGKPSCEGLDFNLSESGGWALLALAASPVGVDLEQVNAREAWSPVWERYFGPGEAQCLQALPPAERNAQFLRRWTQAEALLKLDGCGLQGLERLGPALDAARARAWVLDLDLGADLAASVALPRAPGQWRLWRAPWPGEDFVGPQGSTCLQGG